MSHFTVMVIGNNVEKQLAPFHEFECTGTDDQYVQNVDVTEECIAEGADEKGNFNLGYAVAWYGLEPITYEAYISCGGRPELLDEKYKYGYGVIYGNRLYKAINRTNPNKKWDWYQIGGRWNGFLKLKDGKGGLLGTPSFMSEPTEPGHADSAKKCNIDFDGMRDANGKEAGDRWDKARELIGDTEGFVTWEQCRAAHPKDHKAAREMYNEQPQCKRFREGGQDFSFFASVEDFLVEREAYVQAARDGAVVTFAVVKEGVWYERGSMGWWGCVSNEEDHDIWNKKVSEMLDGLPSDTLITIVDCHI